MNNWRRYCRIIRRRNLSLFISYRPLIVVISFILHSDQSQTPGGGKVTSGSGLPVGEGKRRSMAAIAETFVPRLAKATPVLYSTWGRRDGDPDNANIYPDFKAMNDLTTSGYAEYAALFSDPLIVPAGAGFEIIWNENSSPVTFRDLYWSDSDGSHPSIKGTYMVNPNPHPSSNPHLTLPLNSTLTLTLIRSHVCFTPNFSMALSRILPIAHRVYPRLKQFIYGMSLFGHYLCREFPPLK
jgi:hypothetical protein